MPASARFAASAFILLGLTACQPADAPTEKTGADPSAMAAVDPLIAEALVASRTPDAMMVEDPCGSGKGPAGASIPWVNAEMVKRGHKAEEVCTLFKAGSTAGERIKDMPAAELDAFMTMMDDRAALMRQVSEAQAREIEKIAKGG